MFRNNAKTSSAAIGAPSRVARTGLPARAALRYSRSGRPFALMLAFALALVAGADGAFAQDTAAAPIPSHHGHTHKGHAGDPLAGLLYRLQPQLALNSSQQAQWDNAVAQAKSARAQGSTLRQNVKAVFDAEIAKDQPDLSAVAAAGDAAKAQGQQLQRTVRDAWLGVYANLSPAQKAIVRDALRDRAAKMAEFRANRQSGG